jgi:DNA replication protein DnaC
LSTSYSVEHPYVAAAILDRLLHHGTVLAINGPSYRMRRHHERVEALRAGLQTAGAAKQ